MRQQEDCRGAVMRSVHLIIAGSLRSTCKHKRKQNVLSYTCFTRPCSSSAPPPHTHTNNSIHPYIHYVKYIHILGRFNLGRPFMRSCACVAACLQARQESKCLRTTECTRRLRCVQPICGLTSSVCVCVCGLVGG